MKVREYPGCCSAQILCDFGGTSTSEGRKGIVRARDLLNEVLSQGYIRSNGILTATTNEEQREAVKLLRFLGFTSRKTNSGNHGKPMRLWFIDAEVFHTNLNAIRNNKYEKVLK